MNKIFKIIIVALIMFIPFNINADIEIEKPQDYEKIESTIYIFEETGIKMYSSPSIIVTNEIAIIPNNTKVMLIANRIVDNRQWLYVKYNKYEGWINTAFEQTLYKVAYNFENNYKSVSKDVKLYKSPDNTSEEAGTIKANSGVKVIYFYGEFLYQWYYVESNNIKGWTNEINSFIQHINQRIILLNDTNEYNENYEKQSLIIKSNNVINIKASKIYNSEEYGLYNNGTKDIWIKIKGQNVNYAAQVLEENLSNDISIINIGDSVYEKPSASSKEVFKIKDTTKITDAYYYKDANTSDDYYYIISNDGNGWVTKAFYNYVEEEKTDVPKVDDNKNDKKGSKVSLYIIIFGIIVVLAVIGVFIFNSNKNKRQ